MGIRWTVTPNLCLIFLDGSSPFFFFGFADLTGLRCVKSRIEPTSKTRRLCAEPIICELVSRNMVMCLLDRLDVMTTDVVNT